MLNVSSRQPSFFITSPFAIVSHYCLENYHGRFTTLKKTTMRAVLILNAETQTLNMLSTVTFGLVMHTPFLGCGNSVTLRKMEKKC